jgi:hypothetical protein
MEVTDKRRYELWMPGDNFPTFTFFNWASQPKKTLSRTAAFKPPTYGGRPDITKQYSHPFFTWEFSSHITGHGLLILQQTVKYLDELALHPTQQFALWKDYTSYTSLVVRPDLTDSVLYTATETYNSVLAPFVYCAHNVIIESFTHEAEYSDFDRLSCNISLVIREIL